jgi:hypothetical protein
MGFSVYYRSQLEISISAVSKCQRHLQIFPGTCGVGVLIMKGQDKSLCTRFADT